MPESENRERTTVVTTGGGGATWFIAGALVVMVVVAAWIFTGSGIDSTTTSDIKLDVPDVNVQVDQPKAEPTE